MEKKYILSNILERYGNEVEILIYNIFQIILVVNVASECGYTDSNYKGLTKLQKHYGNDEVIVFGFPCNQYGRQEPGHNHEIDMFVQEHYNINFPLYSKVNITGNSQSEIYRYLIENTGSTPRWNFCKYLVNQHGKVVQFFTQTDSFESIYQSIDYLLYHQHKEL